MQTAWNIFSAYCILVSHLYLLATSSYVITAQAIPNNEYIEQSCIFSYTKKQKSDMIKTPDISHYKYIIFYVGT